MIAALLLLATLARADEAATYDRLFGDEPAPAATVESAELPSPWRLVGPATLAVVGLAGAWWVKKRAPAVGGAKPLSVVWRQALGDRGTLVLIEVLDADGETRRLLIGTGGGPPSLVADLGTCLSVEVYADMPAVSPEVAVARPAAPKAPVAKPEVAKAAVAVPAVAPAAAARLAAPKAAPLAAAAPNAAPPKAAPPRAAAPKAAPRPAPGLATYAAYAAAAEGHIDGAPAPRNVASELLAERRKIAC
ncbi:MAG: hypothetical protein Q8P18_32465 [Pseudomonadota bacterium]|nr:hypothetical protein [Pseudomonadota bacterium]